MSPNQSDMASLWNSLGKICTFKTWENTLSWQALKTLFFDFDWNLVNVEFVCFIAIRQSIFVSLMFRINKHKADNQLFRSNFPQIFHYILLTLNAVTKSFYYFFEKKIISHCQLFHSDLTSKFLEAKSTVK